MLEGANIKLSGTITDINGKSARSILNTILSGTAIDSSKYDEMYKKKIIAHKGNISFVFTSYFDVSIITQIPKYEKW